MNPRKAFEQTIKKAMSKRDMDYKITREECWKPSENESPGSSFKIGGKRLEYRARTSLEILVQEKLDDQFGRNTMQCMMVGDHITIEPEDTKGTFEPKDFQEWCQNQRDFKEIVEDSLSIIQESERKEAMKESEGDYRRDYWRDQFASQAFEKQARQLVLDPGYVSELKTRKNEVIGKKASINPRKAFEQAINKQAVAAMNKDWTLSRRMDELYADFLQQVKWELVKMEPEVANKVKLHWEPRGHGFMWLGADFIAADGKRQEVTFLPETPFQAAGEILYKHGGY